MAGQALQAAGDGPAESVCIRFQAVCRRALRLAAVLLVAGPRHRPWRCSARGGRPVRCQAVWTAGEGPAGPRCTRC